MSNKNMDTKLSVNFTKASTRQNITSGENISTSFGKISKYLDDLGSAAFTDSSDYATPTDLSNKVDKVTGKELMPSDLLDVNGDVALSHLPDIVLGQMIYGGIVNASNVATLSSNAKTKLGTTSNTITLTNNTASITGYVANEGIYYIATGNATLANLGIKTGDWLLSTGSAWSKIDNTDEVSSVNNKTGAVTLNASDVSAVSTSSNQGLTDTEKSNARTNIGAGTSSFSGSYNDLDNKPNNNLIKASGSSFGTTTINSNSASYLEINQITVATDLNTLTTTGIYVITAYNCPHAPVSNLGTMFVDFTSLTPYQIYIIDAGTRAVYKRGFYNNSSWSSWTQINTDTTYTSGAGITITGSNNAINVSYGTVANTACEGNDSRLSNARPASDVYSWAKASTKPTYTASEVGLGNVGNFKAVSTVASQGLTDTEKANARTNIGAGTSSFSGDYDDLSNKPTIPDISGKADRSATVSTVTYDTTNKKLTKTIDGTTSDIVTTAKLKTDMALSKSDVGLSNVDNTSDLDKPISNATQAALNNCRKYQIVQFNGTGSSETHCLICTIAIVNWYINGPIEIVLQERARTTINRLQILYASSATLDPELASFKVIGEYSNFYIYKSANSTWEIYATKSSTWSLINVVDYSLYTVTGGSPGINIVWNMTDANLPSSGAIRAVNVYALENHTQASSTINAMTDYTKPSSTSAITTSDTLNQAIGKLEKGLSDVNTTIGNINSVLEEVL